ncbi:methyl-accepting chemotaxis protein [Alkalimarinus sediminis]|uniref:Methyl-accepting chemotaxis protein n=1 Tax=Alkalimarinus sediminis TaxID=1632866 RepID=A0A9E8HSW6_9ALTE|nr:methyl-accepting chemotaxis protein [Alkalimarinus sediminis]UZW75164.1 methyl-accepting chemotaxis protein [Alkalimarinus sediminis]
MNTVSFAIVCLLTLYAMHTETDQLAAANKHASMQQLKQTVAIVHGMDAVELINSIRKTNHFFVIDQQSNQVSSATLKVPASLVQETLALSGSIKQASSASSLFSDSPNQVVTISKHPASGTHLGLVTESPSFLQVFKQEASRYAVVATILMIALLLSSQLLISFIERHINKLKKVMLYVQSEKDLTARVEIDSLDEVGQMASAFNQMQDGRVHTIKTIRQSAETLSHTSKSLSQSSQDNRDGMDRQSTQSDQLASAMLQMNAAANEISQRAVETHQISESASEKSREGSGLVLKTTQAITQLSGDISNAAEMVSALNLDSQKIESATEEIRAIADQTNLLALNAAIEAARAGESGRGFAVVADEVRKLAIHAQEATDQIQTVVSSIKQATTNINQTMENSRAQADECVNAAEGAASSIEEINDIVTQVTDKNMLIAAAAEQQSQTSDEINSSIQLIQDDTHQVYLNTETIAESSQQIKSEAEHLFNTVSAMRIE